MANIPDITYAHPNYPELLTENKLKKRWLKWIKSCQAAQETSEKREGNMKEQINILKKAINRGDLVNAAEIPVNGDVKKFRNRDAVERGILAGIVERKVNAQYLLTTQQRGSDEKKQNNQINQKVQEVVEMPAERKEGVRIMKASGNLQKLFDESEDDKKTRLSSRFDLPGPVSWDEWEKWNKKAGGRKKSKKRKRRKTKRKKSRRRKTKKRKRKTKKRKRKTKKRK